MFIKPARRKALSLLTLAALLALPSSASAVSSNGEDFESYATGTPNGQGGWVATGAAPASPGYDHAIVNSHPAAPASFGAQSLRISNAVGGGHSNQTFSPGLPDHAGNADGEGAGLVSGDRHLGFFYEFDIASTVPGAHQPGLKLGTSPVPGDGARMSLLNIFDQPSGLHLEFWGYDPTRSGTCSDIDKFTQSFPASGIDRSVPHTLRVEMRFTDGPNNDVVLVYLDGSLILTSTSWEDYFRECIPPGSRPVDSVQFRTSDAAPATLGNGFLIDNLDYGTFDPIIDCDTATDDIAAIQGAIDSAPGGSRVLLNGTCDLTGAAAHGGSQTSIAAAALVVRSPSIDGLRITSLDPSNKAILLGGGTQAAIYVGPGNRNITIDALRFENLARAIVVHNAADVTIGSAATSPQTIPDPLANRIAGNGSLNSAILALGVVEGASVTVQHGVGGSSSATFSTPAGQKLSDLSVLGNYISYNPPGPPTTTTDVVAIDVRQRAAGTIEGVQIDGNAVGMFGTEFPSFNQNGIRVHAHAGDPNYHVSDVQITANNLGRLEEADQVLPGAGDVHASGRAGIVLARVRDFTISSNGVRTRMSPTGVPMPGGGIVVSDSSDGVVSGNGVIVLADPSTLNADLGAIGIMDDVNALFGAPTGGVPAERVIVRNNTIGPVGSDTPGLGAQRALVLNGAVDAVVTGNNVKFASGPAISLGVAASGPGAIGGLPVTVQSTVEGSLVCQNTLEGETDDDANVQADDVTHSAFPGGEAVPVDNVACLPTIAFDTGLLTSTSGPLQASGEAWPGRPVDVVLSGPGGGPIVRSTTAAADGAYTVIFSVPEWNTYSDGTLTGVATVTDTGAGISAASSAATVSKMAELPPTPTITAPGNGAVVPPSFVVQGGALSGLGIELFNGPTLIGTTTAGAASTWQVSLTGMSGALALQAFSIDGDGNRSVGSAVVNVTVDASVPAPPVFTAPTCGGEVNSNAVTISGSAASGSLITVRKLSPAPPAVLGTATADGAGAWSVVTTLPDGTYLVAARAQNGVGTSSSESTCSFVVRTDFAAPGPPVISTPVNGSVHPRLVPIAGTAEIGTTVRIMRGTTLLGTTPTRPDGTWDREIGFNDGSYTIHAVARDGSGNDSASSNFVTFTVDGIRPRVAITTSELVPQIGDLTVGGTASDNVGVARVELRITDLLFGGETITNATLAAPGAVSTTWSLKHNASTCVCQVTATSFDAAGNRSAVDTATFIQLG